MRKIKKPKTTLQKIQAILGRQQDAQYRVDEMVEDQASHMASAINNDGLSSQLEFLNQHDVSDEEVLEDLEEIYGKVE